MNGPVTSSMARRLPIQIAGRAAGWTGTLRAPGPARTAARLPWWLAAGGIGAASSLAGTTGGLSWYFSGMVLGVNHEITYPVRIRAVHGERVVLSRDVDTQRPIRLGLTWPGGHALLTPEVSGIGRRTLVRRIDRVVRGTPFPGTAFVTGFHHDGDPTSAHGLPFRTVAVPGMLGPLPAWYVPAPGDTTEPGASPAGATWVIAVHGRGANPAEALRVIPALHGAGLPVLAISYRNDVGCPPSPDGFHHLADTEWHDLASAIRYARDNGAGGVVLVGWSMGGAISLTALRRMPVEHSALIRGVILDCPVIDWRSVLEFQAAQRHLPDPLVRLTARLLEYRAGMRLTDLDQRGYVESLAVPVLMFVDRDDLLVPPGPALEFARARPDMITLVETTGGGHTRSWNVDPDGYADHVTAFLGNVAGPTRGGTGTVPESTVPGSTVPGSTVPG